MNAADPRDAFYPNRGNRWKRVVSLLAGLLAGFVVSLGTASAQPAATRAAGPAPENPFRVRVKAPALEGGVAWLNTSGPIELSKLKGKIVLLDFWTFCCINCIHVLPDLARLEKEFANELVVIGVHSAKFDGERKSDNIREAILRYGIEHPVVNDAKMEIWSNYGIRSWPSLILIDPEGFAVRGYSGEGKYDELKRDMSALIRYHQAKGTLDRRPLHFQLETLGSADTPLRFPGKVIADPDSNRIFIADSSHHRVVVAALDSGKILQVIGDGLPQLVDGDFKTARFNDPQGLALRGNILYLADRKNHALRKLDLDKRTVLTLGGNGERGYERFATGKGKEIALASPWDLCLVENTLYIAMAGTHQIWKMDVTTEQVSHFAGNGAEDITDGNLFNSTFAQPSGLVSDGKTLYVADSEVSAIRAISLPKGPVTTVIGTGLFDFGDQDGSLRGARLQHALGVALHDRQILVADTYNNKIRTIDMRADRITTYLGDGTAGDSDTNPIRFDEPGGIFVAGTKAYVADTNNHKVRIIDLTKNSVSTFVPLGLQPPKPPEAPDKLVNATATTVPALILIPKGSLTIKASVKVPEKNKLNPDAPMTYQVVAVLAKGGEKILTKGRIKPVADQFDIPLKDVDWVDVKEMRLVVVYYPCEEGSEGVCRVLTRVWQIPLQFDAAKGQDKLTLNP